MTCPTCGGELVPGGSRCPVCDASVAPRVEGALATDPRLMTPPARGKRVDSPREIPGLRKREKTWRDEVQERVRSRRQKRVDAGLPLFDQPEREPEPAAPPAVPPVEIAAAEEAERPSPRPVAVSPVESRDPRSAVEPDLVSTRLSEAELADLPLRAPTAGELAGLDREVMESAHPRRPVPSPAEASFLGDADLEADNELPPPVAEAAPVERPARAVERAQAAAGAALLFGALSARVVYFTGRGARGPRRSRLELAGSRLVPRLPRAVLRGLLHRHDGPDTGQADDGPARRGRDWPAARLSSRDGAGLRRAPGHGARRAGPAADGVRPGGSRAARPPVPYPRRPQLSRRVAGGREG